MEKLHATLSPAPTHSSSKTPILMHIKTIGESGGEAREKPFYSVCVQVAVLKLTCTKQTAAVGLHPVSNMQLNKLLQGVGDHNTHLHYMMVVLWYVSLKWYLLVHSHTVWHYVVRYDCFTHNYKHTCLVVCPMINFVKSTLTFWQGIFFFKSSIATKAS